MRVLVATIVHDPRDARIYHRQIAALLQAGHVVTYAAPFRAYGVPEPREVRSIDLPRAAGRRRVAAILAARRLIRSEAPHHDVVLVHDPELLLALPSPRSAVRVWDVHEDTAAALSMKAWLPAPLRGPTAALVRTAERVAEGRVRLILAEEGYRSRFRHDHPVVPNSTWVPESVPPPGDDRVTYVGSITMARGAAEMVELGRLLEPDGVRVHLVGSASGAAKDLLTEAAAAGAVEWHDYLPNDEAMALLEGSLAGLSLLHDEPNYRHSQPTKVIEYMAHGVPVVTTPTPPARALVEASRSGLVVPFSDPVAAADAICRLRDDPRLRATCAANGRATARVDLDWNLDGARFSTQLERWVARSV